MFVLEGTVEKAEINSLFRKGAFPSKVKLQWQKLRSGGESRQRKQKLIKFVAVCCAGVTICAPDTNYATNYTVWCHSKLIQDAYPYFFLAHVSLFFPPGLLSFFINLLIF